MSESVTVSSDGVNDTITVDGDTIVIPRDDVTLIEVGIQGPAGPQGIPGSGGDKHYEQTFVTASSVTVTHNLGKFPAVSVLDSADDEVIGDVQHITINQLIVVFSAPFSGIISCN